MPAIESTFLSLDFIYIPTGDVDSTARHYVEVLGADLRWKVRGMGTVVACVTMAGGGPAVLTRPDAAGKFDGIVDEPS
ncbi:MAG: hypothetical protein Q8K72_08795 [Acidimicrobiales bacterium]|nr:hypothetical protein [Acidimicrobiales bacterium]